MKAISAAKYASGIARDAADWAAECAMSAEFNDPSDIDAPAVDRFCKRMRDRIDWIEQAQSREG